MVKSLSNHTFRGSAMVPLLLLLLLHETHAGYKETQVCVNTSSATITTTITSGSIIDNKDNAVTCQKDGFPCVFICTNFDNTWFNGSYFCLHTNVTDDAGKFEYNIKPYGTCTLHLCENGIIEKLIKSYESSDAQQKELMLLFYIRNSCEELFRKSSDVKKVFINVERHIIHNIMNIFQPGTINMIDLSLNVGNYTALYSTDPWIQTESPQLLPQSETFVPEVWLPVTGLHNIPSEKRIIGLVSYRNNNQFQFDQEQILSMVIRIEALGEQHLHDLTTPIKMIFRNISDNKEDNTSRIECRYFDEHYFVWKTDGCETTVNETNVTCSCNHATPFAILMIRDQPISAVHWKILSHISYVGCALSAFFTSLSIVVYVFIRNPQMEFSVSIHVSLSGALFLLNTTFMLTEWGAKLNIDWVCVCVASLMHYSLLSCFTWMAIEALHLYLLLIKVFNTYYKHYLVKLSLAGWGIPGVIVAVSLAVKDFKQFYGLTEMTIANSNNTNAICWITDDSFFYSLNLVYFTMIFIFNTGILLTVASSICKMKQTFRSKPKPGGRAWGDPEKLRASCRNALTVLGLTCLMGTTWGLAFLGSGYVNYPILYLFCIFNSLQGFFIFLWICLSVDKQRKKNMEDRQISSPGKTVVMKSE
ncbi:Adhesion G-protein coupled receptor G6 [Larimichthys crocea]|uniref:Uncharacterized protein n=1 Tax=Larimichthys crocea TaxID=215358 RepID=A0ACD3R2W1_LARCR|nr:Adhesion G-protein coupled receptor G6 [Larimichthys crocea]